MNHLTEHVTIERTKQLRLTALEGDAFGFESTLVDIGWMLDEGDGREVVHRLAIRGTIHPESFELADIEPSFEVQPFGVCGLAVEAVRSLEGLRVARGYRRSVLDLMGATKGCSHFLSVALELSQLHTLITYTRMRHAVPRKPRTDPEWLRRGLGIEPRLENACLALAEDSPVILAAKEPES